ncbi:hypothetical protein AVEN_66117-1 [Araneus ventricosus]|uniref:Uncharacterized protein n=1 Tax=Araneus ventricosus TaxID=182803 RepID=A0A4Y2G0L5_ARAVE|nr:hypothetical protein AVEN_66117-1 [Araneus ventricosus]
MCKTWTWSTLSLNSPYIFISGEIWLKPDSMDPSEPAQSAVILFLSLEGVSGTDIYSRMKNTYGTESTYIVQFADEAVILIIDVEVQTICRNQVKHIAQSIAAVDVLAEENRRIIIQDIYTCNQRLTLLISYTSWTVFRTTSCLLIYGPVTHIISPICDHSICV